MTGPDNRLQSGGGAEAGPIAGPPVQVSCDETVVRSAESSTAGLVHDVRRAPDLSRIGDYELIRELGQGGMGIVYLGRHVRLGRLAAVKVIRPGLADAADTLQRFQSEASAAAQLDHPGIVPVFESGVDGPQQYLALAYVEGQTLRQRIDESPLEPREAAGLMEQVARAVQYAHERGIVHRDLKPHNVLITRDGQPRVTDFGLAKIIASEATLTATGEILGTPSYMPPEQAAGVPEQVGPAADIYALGATLYCAVSGRPPFQAANVWEVLRLVREEEPVSLRILNPRLDRDLDTICQKCLHKSPAQRYASAAALADDLQRYLNRQPIQARRISRLERSWRWCRRNPVVAGLAAASVMLLMLVAAVSTWGYFRQKTLTSEMSSLAIREQAQRIRAENQLYYSQTVRGAASLAAGDFAGADAALDDRSPLRLRGWEYRYLQRQREGTPLTLYGPDMPVLSLAFSANGRRLASGWLENETDVWNIETGELEYRLESDGGTICAVHFHPARDELVSVSAGGLVTIWDLTAGQSRAEWIAHEQPVGSADLDRSGRLLATGSADGTIKLWDFDSAELRDTLSGHTAPVQTIAFNADGSRLVSGAASGDSPFELRVWDCSTGDLLQQADGRFHIVNRVRFSPDDRHVATVSGQTVTVYDAGTLDEQQSFQALSAVTEIVWSPDGTQLTLTELDGTVEIYDDHSLQLQRTLGHHAEPVLTAAYSADGYFLATGSGRLAMRGENVAPSPGQIKVWSLNRLPGEPLIAVDQHDLDPVTNYLNAVAFETGTPLVATGGWRGKVALVDALSGEEAAPEADFGCVIIDLQFHPRAPILVVSGTTAGPYSGLALYNVETRAITGLPGHSGGYVLATLSLDGTRLASTGNDRIIKLWDVESAAEMATLSGHTLPVKSLAFDPQAERLVSLGQEEGSVDEVKMWDVSSGDELPIEADAALPVGKLDPLGELLATREPNGTLEIWKVDGGQKLHALRGHLDSVPGLAFAPDGRRLFSASRDGTIRLWDPREGIEIHQFPVAPDFPNDVAVSSDGSLLACATQSGFVRIWDARLAGDALSLAGHSSTIEAYGFAGDGLLISRDVNGETLEWVLPEGESHVSTRGIDPTPLPAESPDGDWTASVDRRDTSILRVERSVAGQLPFHPWQEEAGRRHRESDGWHIQRASAAEAAGDWFSAAFHLRMLLGTATETPAVLKRLEAAERQINIRDGAGDH